MEVKFNGDIDRIHRWTYAIDDALGHRVDNRLRSRVTLFM
jgi:hypothetical protein